MAKYSKGGKGAHTGQSHSMPTAPSRAPAAPMAQSVPTGPHPSDGGYDSYMMSHHNDIGDAHECAVPSSHYKKLPGAP